MRRHFIHCIPALATMALAAVHGCGSSSSTTSNSWNIGTPQTAATSQTLGLNLAISFQLLDGGLQEGRITESQANLDRARADLEGARQRVLSQVGQAYLNLRNAEQQVTSATAEEANAKETLRLTNGRYKVGLGTFLEVLDAQSALLTAQTNQVNAVTQVYLSRAALNRAASGAPASPTQPAEH